MEPTELLLDLETGICLWIGAGVTKHLAKGIGADIPDWNSLTTTLERKAHIVSAPDAQSSNPRRLNACMRKLGAATFRREVSRHLYGALCAALAKYAHDHRGQLAEPPRVAFELAALGWLANPIVNFNVETLTSSLIARPAGPCRVLPYRGAASDGVFEQQEGSRDFSRLVYHPHGAVNYSGRAVMTSSEYAAHKGSLAYLLSVSAAFENNLWIVGMSLDDEYLRKHLKQHRKQIRCVRWFDSDVQLKKHGAWARAAQVSLIPVLWPDFWALIRSELGHQVRRAGVMTAWYHAVSVAIAELVEGDTAAQLASIATRIPALADAARRAASKSHASYRRMFAGGKARHLLPKGFDAQAISAEMSAAIRAASDLVTKIQETVKSGGDVGRDMSSALELAIPRRPSMRQINI